MRVLVLWADDTSPNLGVRALGRGTAALVRRVWPDAEMTFQNYGHPVPQLPFGRIRSLVRERITGQRGMQKWLSSHDLVIDTRSGDSFADIYGLPRLGIMSTVAEFASQAGVPVVLGPQTVGPFGTHRGRLMAKRSLHRAALVMARDTESARHAEHLGRPADLVTTDVVFAIDAPAVERTLDVVLNISGLLWNPNPHVDSRHYRATVTRLHEELVARGRTVTLLAHVIESDNADDDVPAIREFARNTAPDAEIVIPDGLDEVRSVVASARLVFGSRMHACLNALSVGTPAIPLAYSRKFEPLFQDLGWEHTVDLRNHEDVVGAALRHQESAYLQADVTDVVGRARRSLAVAESALRALP